MTTEEQFNCIFCKESFCSKEELQIHFRKHGDPNFDKSTKSKNRSLNDSPNPSEKLSEDNEMVGCDVCEEVFPTISKAITHKHKVHPDHDAKYFCPFCGKLFTMKHLYNKHIQSNHDPQLSKEKSEFHCDSCEVMFYVPSAMLYHNKFFHRLDQEVQGIGGSKKVKLCSQELIQLYYCAFCGDEYNNKVNLQKHVADDHGDENQSPADILKCPLCDAMFYHLDAYELHLMFHTTEDVYSERNEMADEITEFSLETVPPITEKVEDESTQDNSAGDGVDMENFLQLLMGESEDNVAGKIKTKKHKKHKKSKKAAITLDEFLNMNKDVFGDGLDVQGIEEVPTQVMLKKMKGKKPVANKTKINADINKLKKIGITVKTKSSHNVKPIINRCVVNRTASLPSNIDDKKTNLVCAPEDVLSKLMRQGNSEIKIVKKVATQDTSECETAIDTKNIPANDSEEKKNKDNNIDKSNDNKGDISANNDMLHTENGNEDSSRCPSAEVASDLTDENPLECETNLKQSEVSSQHNFSTVNFNNTKNPSEVLSEFEQCLETNELEMSPSKENKNNTKSDSGADMSNEICSDKASIKHEVDSNNTLGALKHLSHLITIKPVKQSTQSVDDDYDEEEIDNLTKQDSINTSSNSLKDSEVPKLTKLNPSLLNKTSEALKNLSRNLTVKSISNNSAKFEGKKDKSDDSESNRVKTMSNENSNPSQIAAKDLQKTTSEGRLNNVVLKQVSTKDRQTEMPTFSKTNIKIEKPVLNKGVDDEIEIFNIDDSDSEDEAKKTENLELNKNTALDKVKESVQLQNVIHNLGSNITIKSNYQKLNEVKNKPPINESNVNKFTKVNKLSPEIQKSINLQNTLKNLGSHITIKSKNTSSTYSNEEFTTFDNNGAHSDSNDSDSETEVGNVKITEVTEEASDHEEDKDECDTNAIVNSPSSHDNDSDQQSNDESDFEAHIQANNLKKSNQSMPINSASDNIRNTNKELVIKPCNEKKNNPENVSTTAYEKKFNPPTNVPNLKPVSQGSNNQINTINRKMNTSANEVNTVKTVKKFQTETVIQEITTVTRTIRTVNESSNEIVQTSNQNFVSPTPQKINRVQPGKEHQGKVIRHVVPTVGTKVRNPGMSRPANQTAIRTPNQIVPIRSITSPIQQSNATPRKPLGPGSQIRKTASAMNTPQKLVINKLKMSPNVITQSANKRPLTDGNFTAIGMKKPKESTISTPKTGDATMEQFTASTSRSEFSSVTKTMKGGKSSMSATQTRSEVNTTTQQQLSRLSNMSGLKIMKKSTKQAVEVEEKSEVCATKRNTLDAIEKLQKQGLLVKKPRVEFNDTSEHDFFSESDEEDFEQ